MDEETHVPKKMMINGKERIVYVRTEQTEREMEHYRMGFFAGVAPLPLTSFGGKLKEQQLIILAHYNTAESVIRTRLELDKRSHKVLTGTDLLQYYFEDGSSTYLEGFPVFKQIYLMFGYSESGNRKLHELVNESLHKRRHAENHCWLIIPKTLEAMAAQWGNALLDLQMFSVLDLREEPGAEPRGPVSVANPAMIDAVGESVIGRMQGFEAPPPLEDDPEEARRRRRDYEKWRQKSYE
jgi:hypothetical protein